MFYIKFFSTKNLFLHHNRSIHRSVHNNDFFALNVFPAVWRLFDDFSRKEPIFKIQKASERFISL